MVESLIDVREYAEFASGHIEGAQHLPLRTISEASLAWDKGRPLTLVCQSGRRAEEARKQLAERGFTSVSVLPGGMESWLKTGKPVKVADHHPWAMERQVRTAAGALVLATLTLGYFRSRYFLLGTLAVGSGLVYAGVSNTCLMGSALAHMPWNRSNRMDA